MQRLPIRIDIELMKKVKLACPPGGEVAFIQEAINEKLNKPAPVKPAPQKPAPEKKPEGEKKEPEKKEDIKEEKE